MSSPPAICGGEPVFPRLLHLSRPSVYPEASAARLAEVLATGRITNGARVREFEERVAEYVGVEHAVAVSSNTVGLLLLLAELRLEGEAVMPSFTFCATGHAASWNRLELAFVDVLQDTLLVDPERVAAAIGPRTAVVVAVPIWGHPCDNVALEQLSAANEVRLVFDSAQALGSSLDGRMLGSFGTAEVFSLSPSKPVTACEGGVITTRDGELAAALRRARNYGLGEGGDCVTPGLNARMSELHAVIGLAAMEAAEENLEARRARCGEYARKLGGIPGLSLPALTPGSRINGVYLPVRVGEGFGMSGEALVEVLRAENVESRRYYVPPLHRLSAYREERTWDLPVTERAAAECVSLPLFAAMGPEDVDRVCDAVARIHEHRTAVIRELVR